MQENDTIEFEPFHLNYRDESLWRQDQRLSLTPKAFSVLRYLVSHASQLVTRDELFQAVWPGSYVSDDALTVCVRELRRVLGDQARAPQYIETVRGRGYRFVATVAVQSQNTSPLGTHEAMSAPERPVMVARERELTTLHEQFSTILRGERKVIFISGEAGIGKTTLVDTFVSQIEPAAGSWIGRGQCIEQFGAGEPYMPLLEALGRLGRSLQGARLVEVLRQQAPSWLVHLPVLMTPQEAKTIQLTVGSATRERMLRELAEAIETLTAVSPLILILEDLHWSDVSTIEWLAYAARRRDPARLFVLGTYRPAEAIVHNHPVRTVTQELQQQGQGDQLDLDYLTEASVRDYLTQRFSNLSVPAYLSRLLHQRTDGNPLFLVTLVDDMVRQGGFSELESHGEFPRDVEAAGLEIPQSLRHMIERQLEQLIPEEQTLLEAASVAGVEFAAATVAATMDDEVETIETRCDHLARQELFVRMRDTAIWPDGTVAAHYGFRHALYQEVLYDRVPVSRRVRWHRQIGRCLEMGYGARARVGRRTGGAFHTRTRPGTSGIVSAKRGRDRATAECPSGSHCPPH